MIKYSNVLWCLFISFLWFLCSCVNEKNLVYFKKSGSSSNSVQSAEAYIPKIQTGDILSIDINSLSPEASSFFNPYSQIPGSSATSPTGLTQSAAPGYLVNTSGNIELHLVGDIKLSGYTIIQAADTIKERLKKFLKEPTVTVRFLNYKISILGEVVKPNVYVIPNEKVAITEALSLAGDLTIYGRRDSIEIIRDVNGVKEFGYVNLGSRDIFSSPYYYLHANDLIYVQPVKAKAVQLDRTFPLIALAVSVGTLILLIVRK